MDAQAGPDIRPLFADLAAVFDARAADLDGLDAAVGDGDHGTTLARGFTRASEAVEQNPSTDPGTLLRAAGRALLTMGGASGPLFATIFLEAGKSASAHATDGQAAVTAQSVAAMLTAAADGVQRRGKVIRGDKTLYDALAPAADAARSAAENGAGVPDVVDAAAAAARAGAEGTRMMIGRKGRAAFMAERSAGHPDPGAIAIAMLLEAVSQYCRKYGAPAGAT